LTNCVSCGRPAVLLIHEQALPCKLAVYRCRNCAIDFFSDAAHSDYWDTPMQDSIYADGAVADERAAFFRSLLARLSALCPGRSMLDVGAGRGEFCVEALNAGYDVSALEPSEKAAAGLRERGVSEVYNCTLEQLAPSRRYDAVAMLDVLEHLTDPLAAVRKAASCLNPGGVLIVLTPDGGSFARKAILNAARAYRPLECLLKYQYYLPHLCYVGETALRACAGNAGLHVVRVEKSATPKRFLLSKLACHYAKYPGNRLVCRGVSLLYPALRTLFRNKITVFMRKPT